MLRHMSMAVALLLASNVWAGHVVTDSIKSEVLGAWVRYNVYLPSGFEHSTDQYPVVYLLHGFTDDYTAWRDKGNMQLVADELIESGEATPMVIIMPNAGGPQVEEVWNGYFNMPGWAYEDFFFQELVPWVEARYRIVGDKAHRAVMGLSMGGGGSTVYAQRHPEMFSSCYAMSAWLESEGGDPNKKGKVYYVTESVREHSAIRYIQESDEDTRRQLRTVRWFFDCGDDDFLFDLSVRIHQEMRRAHIKDELRIRNGVHNWEYWHQALRLALPFASRDFR